jgi:site-specific DNA-cytosine methylase
VTAPTITAGWGTNHGGPGHGGKDDAALAVTAATLQGGGRRGHRIDAEGAAGGHLIAHALTAREGKGPDSDATNGFILAPAIRRLTPTECERLQGLPDDWTRWKADGTEQFDSARYRQCGNSVAVPCVEWIARRLVVADLALATEAGEAA